MKQTGRVCLLLLILSPLCFAQPAGPGWQLVSGGNAAAQPVKTDYGFAMLLEGRTLAAVSDTGVLLWEKGISGKPEPFLGVGNGNFLYVATDENNLNVYNPSGLCLWTNRLPSKIVSAPKQGRDGRIFVQCRTGVGCYGVNGIPKWFLQTEESAGFPLYELEDGSLLNIQRKTINGGSTAIRISPFGTILEEITFTGIIRTAAQSAHGVVLVFEDGSTGCCSSQNNAAESRWMLQPEVVASDGGAAVLRTDSKNGLAAYVVPSGTDASDIVFVQLQTGTVRNRLLHIPVSARNLTYADFSDKTLILCDNNSAGAYTDSAQTVWSAPLPADKPWSYLLYLDNGYLTVFEKNTWITAAYRMTQKIGTAPPYTAAAKKTPSYPVYCTPPSGVQNQPESAAVYAALLNGKYGQSEADWIRFVDAETEQLLARFSRQNGNSRPDVTIYDSDLTHSVQIIRLMGAFATETFTADIASLITNETDISMISAALQAASQAAYDPDGVLLNAIQKLVHKKNIVANRRVAKDICDAVYQICRFMGKPALFSKGIDILRYFFYPQFDRQTKEYASQTMQKIISLQM